MSVIQTRRVRSTSNHAMVHVRKLPCDENVFRANEVTTVVDVYAPGTDIAVPGSNLITSGTSFGELWILFLISVPSFEC